MTEKEQECLNKLTQAWNIFLKLPQEHLKNILMILTNLNK